MADSEGINYWTETAVMHTVNSDKQNNAEQYEFIQDSCACIYAVWIFKRRIPFYLKCETNNRHLKCCIVREKQAKNQRNII